MSIYSRNYGKEENPWLREKKDTLKKDLHNICDMININLSEIKLKPEVDYKDFRKILQTHDVSLITFKIAYHVNDRLKLEVNDDEFNKICDFVRIIYYKTIDIYQEDREVTIEDVSSYICCRLNDNTCTMDDLLNVQTRFLKEIAQKIVDGKIFDNHMAKLERITEGLQH